MKIFKAFAAILLLATSLFALSKEQIKPEIEAKTTNVIEILKNTNLDVKESLENLFNGENVEEVITGNSDLSSLLNYEDVWELLVFSGYLTIKEKIDRRNYILKIPNQEIREFFKNPANNMEKFFNSEAITWVDWREYDEDIISYFNGLLPQEDIVNVEIKEIKLGRGIDIILKKDNKTLTIPYEDDKTDRDITIKTLNEFIIPKYQIRVFMESIGDDTIAFTILNSDEWKELENSVGKKKLDFFFTPVSELNRMFNMSIDEAIDISKKRQIIPLPNND